MGSIESAFQLISYKIDSCSFEVLKEVGLLEVPQIPQEAWKVHIAIRHPMYFRQLDRYVAGLDVNLRLSREKGDITAANVVTLHMGIAGSFQVKGEVDPAIQEKMVRVQFPALLFPFLRSALSSFLLQSGFSNFILPLINVHELAEKQLKDVPITIFGETMASESK